MQKKTLEILKNFSTINSGIIIKKGSTLRTMSTSKNILANVEVADSFPREFAIYDLNEFLSTLSLFANPTLSYENDHISIKSGGSSVKYYYSSPTVVVGAPEKDLSFENANITMQLEKEDLAQLIKASSVMQLDTLELSSNGLRAFNSKTKGGNQFNLETSIIKGSSKITLESNDVKSGGKFQIKLELMKLLPVSYNVRVSDRVVHFSNTDENLNYFIAVDSCN